MRRLYDDLGRPPLPTIGEVVMFVLACFVLLSMTLVDIRL